MKTRIISILVALAAISTTVSAQDNGSSAGFAMPFTRIGHNPVTEAMGGAGILSTTSMAFSAYGNAAAIPFSENKGDIAASYQSWSPSATNYVNAGAAFNLNGKIGLCASFTTGMNEEVELMDNDGIQAGTFKPGDIQAGAGISVRFIDWLSGSVCLSYASQTITPDENLGAVSANAFLMMKRGSFKAAAGVSGLGSKVTSSSGETFSLPLSATAAAGYGAEFGDNAIEAELRGDIYMSGSNFSLSDPFTLSLGGEYTYKKMVSVRAGFHYGGKASAMPSYGSAGLGFCFSGFHIDVACLLAGAESPLKNTITLGLGYRF